MDFASPFVSPIFDHLIQPIGRQFGYVFKYKSNIANLDTQVQNLVDMRSGVQERVKIAQRNSEVIDRTVETWLNKVNVMKMEADVIVQDITRVDKGCLGGWFPNLKGRYVLSRRSKKKTQTLEQLQNEGKSYVNFSYAAPPLEMSSSMPMNEYDSRKHLEETIMSSLRNENDRTIGICGMGGVGKTTMAKRISERAEKEGIFDEVAMAVVSQQPNLGNIQLEIAERLGLKFEQESSSLRANRLHRRLVDVKRMLIILDDVWSRLDLEEIGIPSQSAHLGCKVVLTSRNRDICVTMEANTIFTVEILSREEAWILFKEKAGQTVNSPDLYPIARDVADECKGLPIALITVGRALKDRGQPFWEDALLQLKRNIPTNIHGLLVDVYRPLELSYTRLESNETRYLFLLCTLFKEDVNIPLEDIIRYGMGLSMFRGIYNLEEARNRVHASVEILKDRFLLVESHREGHVKMHDVVRDVGILIASLYNGFSVSHDGSLVEWPGNENCICISVQLGLRTAFPELLDCPKLQLLLLQGRRLRYFHPYNIFVQSIFYPPEGFFQGMSTLRVLELEYMRFPSLPSALTCLRNLRTLHLCYCHMEDISIIGDLKSLQILSFSYSIIRMLPAQIVQLCNLRLLDLTCCRSGYFDSDSLNIERGTISGLSNLEELYMLRSFINWDDDAIKELECLVNLKVLQLDVPYLRKILNTELGFMSNIRSFAIFVGRKPIDSNLHDVRQNHVVMNSMYLDIPMEVLPFGRWVRLLLKHVKWLKLRGNGSADVMKELALEGFKHLKFLEIEWCDELKHLTDASANGISIFPAVQSMKLAFHKNLTSLCEGGMDGAVHFWKGATEIGSFSNVRSISVIYCDKLRYLFPLSVARNLLRLHQLEIGNCEQMTSVFLEDYAEDGNAANKIVLPNLHELKLITVRELSCFCKGIDMIELPKLNILEISPFYYNPKCLDLDFPLTTEAIVGEIKVSLKDLQIKNEMEGLFMHSFFSNLRDLEIVRCSFRSKSLFPPLAAEGLVNLTSIKIDDIKEMEEVIAGEAIEENEKQEGSITPKTVFPKLDSLYITYLNDLMCFCPTKQSWELPSLQSVTVAGCLKMSTFTMGCIKTPKLGKCFINGTETQQKDLNETIQRRFEELQGEGRKKKRRIRRFKPLF